jgi:hypothetical protein
MNPDYSFNLASMLLALALVGWGHCWVWRHEFSARVLWYDKFSIVFTGYLHASAHFFGRHGHGWHQPVACAG